MVAEEVKISSDAAHVFTNGASKEVKEKIISELTNHGFLAEKHLPSFVQI